MPISIQALEVDDFRTAIAGLEVEYVRTDVGKGPCTMFVTDSAQASFSSGTMGFSAISQTEVPDNTVVFSLITATPPGAAWCGVDLGVGQLRIYQPGLPFIGVNPSGLAASFLVVERDLIDEVAASMFTTPVLSGSIEPVPSKPEVEPLRRAMWQASAHPELLDNASNMLSVVEAAVRAISGTGSHSDGLGRRLDSRKIVLDCLHFIEEHGQRNPSMHELCRAAYASESRVRLAFVEVVGCSPTQYLQNRLLSNLRDELLEADPEAETVTRIASSLGVTQLGRIAGRYRKLFDESPSQTLRR